MRKLGLVLVVFASVSSAAAQNVADKVLLRRIPPGSGVTFRPSSASLATKSASIRASRANGTPRQPAQTEFDTMPTTILKNPVNMEAASTTSSLHVSGLAAAATSTSGVQPANT